MCPKNSNHPYEALLDAKHSQFLVRPQNLSFSFQLPNKIPKIIQNPLKYGPTSLLSILGPFLTHVANFVRKWENFNTKHDKLNNLPPPMLLKIQKTLKSYTMNPLKYELTSSSLLTPSPLPLQILIKKLKKKIIKDSLQTRGPLSSVT